MDFALAVIGGSSVIRTLLVLFVLLLCGLLIYYAGRVVMAKLGANDFVAKAWDILFLVLGLIVLVNGLLSFVNRQFIDY